MFNLGNLLDNCLKNNNIAVNIIYYLRQRAKTRPEWISQSNGSIGRLLGFVIDRLNTSASLYRIAPCLSFLTLISQNPLSIIGHLRNSRPVQDIIIWLALRPGKTKQTLCSFIDQACSVRKVEYWPPFLQAYGARLCLSPSTSKKHLGQYSPILTSPLVNKP